MRIRKFNESSASEIDAEYIRQCFADLIDSGVAETLPNLVFGESNTILVAIRLKVLYPQTGGVMNDSDSPESISGNTSIGKYIEAYGYNNGIYQEIGASLEKLADEYPGYKITVEMTDQTRSSRESSCVYIRIYPDL